MDMSTHHNVDDPRTIAARAHALLAQRPADLTEGERDRIAARLADAPLANLAAMEGLFSK